MPIIPLIVATAISFFATFFVIKLAWKIGIIDDPKTNKHAKVIHKYPIPRGGGLAIFLAVTITSLMFIPLYKHLISILIGATLITIIGIYDDKYNISPYFRLGTQFLAASIPIMAGIGISYTTNPFGGIINLSSIQANLFAILWIVVLMNFLNMGAKGVDGQLTGVVVIASAVIAALSFKFSADIAEWPVIILALITTGAFLGFLPWHIYPQKIMPSFSGSNLAGYLLGVLSILTTTKVGTLALVLAVPLIDTGYTIIRRLSQGKSPVWGDRGHLHHRLLDHGWSKRQVAQFYWLITAFFGIIALSLNAQTKLYTMIGSIFLIGGLILWLTYKNENNKKFS